ncbi:methylcrotonoyl-CoA carboxylase, partial [Leptospira sp. 201903070]|nr:methylcrotonoyl-CoA carboxylase [Leptospira ainlahdjerensis]
MEIIESKIRTSSSEYKENFEDLKQKVESVRGLIRRIELGGGEKAIQRHKGRGKFTARERINALIDPGTTFLEFSPLAAEGVYPDSVPSAGILTGIGR